MSAEEEAKAARKNVSCDVLQFTHRQLWSDYSGQQVQETKQDSSAALAPEYLDVYVSAVRDTDPFGFSVQILDDKSALYLLSQCSHQALRRWRS